MDKNIITIVAKKMLLIQIKWMFLNNFRNQMITKYNDCKIKYFDKYTLQKEKNEITK